MCTSSSVPNRTRSPSQPVPTRPSTRLQVEALEDRTVPSTFTVTTKLDVVDPADGKLSLREAVTKANTHAGADVIVLPAGVFKITIPGANENGNATGDFDVTGTLSIRGAGAGLTVIDGQQLDRVFDVAGTAPSSIKVVLQGLTARNGLVTGDGGGIQVGDADLVLRDSVVTGNRASLTGGGISNAVAPGTGNVTLVRTPWPHRRRARWVIVRAFRGDQQHGPGVTSRPSAAAASVPARRNQTAHDVNSAAGGGVSAATANRTDSTVSGNLARAGDGGGINAGTAVLIRSTLSGNSAGTNGGGLFANTAATLMSCTVSGNSAIGTSAGGGGVFANATATLTGCTVSGNSAAGAGGGVVAITTATLTNCTVSGNSAGSGGGGVFATTANLTRSTVSGNSARTFNGGGVAANAATLTRCAIVGNAAGGSGPGGGGRSPPPPPRRSPTVRSPATPPAATAAAASTPPRRT